MNGALSKGYLYKEVFLQIDTMFHNIFDWKLVSAQAQTERD
jgi:hypothetical protein